MTNTNKLFYQCFSGKQKKYLIEKGHKMILKAIHYESKKTMWIFLFDENDLLKRDLELWSLTTNLN